MSSPVRAFGAVGGHPIFIASGQGGRIYDVDGNEYIDLVMSWGPLIHGHAHPDVLETIHQTAGDGTTFGAPTEVELRLAQKIASLMPSMESLRFVSSGTEATMSALRLARAFTNRELVVKFDGCYHGHLDALLVSAGSGALTHGRPSSAGVSELVTETTRQLPFNDIPGVRELFERDGERIAAVIVEPVAGNMGVIPPAPAFLETLRMATRHHGALLIFDEVITGFRVGLAGAQGKTGVVPDLTCIGKIVGGGLPAAAFGGRAEVMELLSPLGPVYQAGTLSGNPVAMAAGLKTLELLDKASYGHLERMAQRLENSLVEAANKRDRLLRVNRYASMFSPFFTSTEVTDLATAQTADASAYATFFRRMLDRGVYLPPSQFETWMLSFAHTEEDVELVESAIADSLD